MRKIPLFLMILFIVSCSKLTRFSLIPSEQTKIDFNNFIEESDSLLIISNGAGLGIADLNNDDLPDIIFAGNQVSPHIYLNQGNFKFKDITANFEGITNKQWYSSVTITDINNDGWPDVYFTSTVGQNYQQRKNRLWVNNGVIDNQDPTFTERAEEYGIDNMDPSINAAFFDYDRDGNLDLYVLNSNLIQRAASSMRPRIKDGTAQNNDRLYHNNGDGTFSDVSKQAGILYEGFGLGLVVGDVNKDGYPDIYVSNDYMTNDLLYINQRDGTFQNEIKKYISYQTESSMGNDMADINNDGNLDIFTLDMLPESYHKKKQTINGYNYNSYILNEKFDYENQYIRNMLHVHNGFLNGEMLPFNEIGQITGLYHTEWSWAPLFADYDNDGDKDLIVSNGYPKDMTDKDWSRMRARLSMTNASEQDIISLLPSVKVPNMAFENEGDLIFTKRTNWLPNIPSFSYGASFVDLDNDGDLDYVTNNFNDKAFVLKNNTIENSNGKEHFIKFSLKGKSGNTMALGTKVELWNDGIHQFTDHFLTRGYASSVDPIIHFGLGGAVSVDSIKITWPASGNVSVFKNVPADQTLKIDEAQVDQFPSKPKPFTNKNLLFQHQVNVLDYTHEQNDFVDFFLGQKIIPHKFSQIGPRMAKGDIDGDGKEDLIIGSTNKSPTKVFLRKGQRFEETKIEGLTDLKPGTESDIVVADFDNDGDNDIIATIGGFETRKESRSPDYRFMMLPGGIENKTGSEYLHYLYENKNNFFQKIQLPIPPFLASFARSCDYNHDGFIDLFIGSRVKKNKFPDADASWILNNDRGKFTSDSSLQFNLGMTTDAVWTDYDNDGWEDLLITREFNSLVLLKNIEGEKFEIQNIPELEQMHGLWFSIIAGDFDMDGDDDYIVGNLGENNQFIASEKYPLNLYGIDIDLNGTLDPIRTAFYKDDSGRMKEFPVHFLDELREQSTLFQKEFENYTSFSHTGIDDILDKQMQKRVEFKLSANTTSSYLLWNNKDHFRWEKLPRALQFSPLKKMLVEDFNHDNLPDVLLGGNDYSFEVGIGNFDANKGIVLLNKGKIKNSADPTFELLDPAQSGILLQGMLESLLYFKGDTSLVVAGFNRSKVGVFQQIK